MHGEKTRLQANQGAKYKKGLTVMVNGKEAAHAATVPLARPLEVELPQ